MQVVALCAKSFAKGVRKAAGVKPLTFPPLTYESFWSDMIVVGGRVYAHPLLYLKFHGLPEQPYLYTDGYVTAMSAEQVRNMKLQGTVVFAAVCHLPRSPLMQALFDAGASAIIAGEGPNYAYSYGKLHGADALGWWVRHFLAIGMNVDKALDLSKRALKLTNRPRNSNEKMTLADTLGFKVYRPCMEAII